MQDFAKQPTPPPVWKWFRAYSIMMAVLYLLVAVFGVILFVIEPASLDMDPFQAKLMGGVFSGLGVLLAIPFFAAPFLPQKSWVWVFDLVLICLGLTSACCLPATIPLLIYWIKPEAKTFFNRM